MHKSAVVKKVTAMSTQPAPLRGHIVIAKFGVECPKIIAVVEMA